MNSKLIILSIVLCLATLALNAKPFNPKKVLYAVNCGSSSVTKSTLGFNYQKVSRSKIID